MKANEAKIRQEIEKALETIRQSIRLHGGDVELVTVDKASGLVKVRMHGACVGCPLSEITLKQGIEADLVLKFPWIKEVQAVE